MSYIENALDGREDAPIGKDSLQEITRHLRHLVLLTMLNYPAVRLEAIMSQEEWLQNQKEIVIPTNWGGDLDVRLMGIGLKKNITIITDSESGSVFGRYFPSTSPPIPKMKGGVFKPLTYEDI